MLYIHTSILMGVSGPAPVPLVGLFDTSLPSCVLCRPVGVLDRDWFFLSVSSAASLAAEFWDCIHVAMCFGQ